MTDETPEKMRARAQRNGYKNGTKYGSLESQVKYDPKCANLLPTPIAQDGERGGARKTNGNTTDYRHHYSATLKDMAKAELLPTPMVLEVHHKERVQRAKQSGSTAFHNRPDKGKDTHPSSLMDYLQFHNLLPTPATSYLDNELNNENFANRNKKNLEEEVAKIVVTSPLAQDGAGFRLSPLFTEEMMGFPLMWTALPFLSENGEQKA